MFPTHVHHNTGLRDRFPTHVHHKIGRKDWVPLPSAPWHKAEGQVPRRCALEQKGQGWVARLHTYIKTNMVNFSF